MITLSGSKDEYTSTPGVFCGFYPLFLFNQITASKQLTNTASTTKGIQARMKHYPQNTNTVASSHTLPKIVTCNPFHSIAPEFILCLESAFNPSKWKISFLHLLKLYGETPILKHRRQMSLSPPVPLIFFQKILKTLGTQGKQKGLTSLGLSQLPCQSPARTTEPRSVRGEKSPSFPISSICS